MKHIILLVFMSFSFYVMSQNITNITPNQASQGQTLSLTISGNNVGFSGWSCWSNSGGLAMFGFEQGGMNTMMGVSTSASQNILNGSLSVPAFQPTGAYDLIVEDCYSGNLIVYPNSFYIGSASWNCTGGACIDPGNGSGVYTSITACMSACGINASWNCVQGTCIDPGNGLGMYSSQAACLAACTVTPTWDCNNGVCSDPGTGNGQYASITACLAACTVTPTWDCDGQGNCFDPGTGNGQYATLALCNIFCTPPATWNCDGLGNCQDPGTGNGQYASLADCNAACIAPSWDCNNGVCYDPGTGQGQYSDALDCLIGCGISLSWDCNIANSVCEYSLTGTGMFSSIVDCKANSLCITNINDENNDFSIYPNPAKNTLIIEGDYNSATIYDVFGKLLLNTNEQLNRIDVSSLNNGIYFVHLSTNNGIRIKKTMIVR